jgi:hypothetical protein
LKHLQPQRPRRALHRHRATLDAAFRPLPPAPVAEAAACIDARPRMGRRPTPVRPLLNAWG